MLWEWFIMFWVKTGILQFPVSIVMKRFPLLRWTAACSGFWPKRERLSPKPWTCRASWAEPSQSRVSCSGARRRYITSSWQVLTSEIQTVGSHVSVLFPFRWSDASRVSCRAWRTDWSSRTLQTAACRTTCIFSKPRMETCSVTRCLQADCEKRKHSFPKHCSHREYIYWWRIESFILYMKLIKLF